MAERMAPPKCLWILFAPGNAPTVYVNAPTRSLRTGEELALYDFAASFQRDPMHTQKPKRKAKR